MKSQPGKSIMSPPAAACLLIGFTLLAMASFAVPPAIGAEADSTSLTVHYKSTNIEGVNIFYREAGLTDAPTIVLLHGFPTSSSMFRNLIPKLAVRYHVIAPDYPGFGQSDSPDPAKFAYTFDHLANIVDQFTQQLNLKTFAIYVQDYGAPIGYRIASAHPERIAAIVVQNGNAYVEGLPDGYWKPIKAFWADPSPKSREMIANAALNLEGYKSQYLIGVKDPSAISPDTWTLDLASLSRPGNKDAQLDLLFDYQNNLKLYPKWHEYFRNTQPPMLIVWGKNDICFPAEGAEAYKQDIRKLDFHLLDTGHFALEDSVDEIAERMLAFLDKQKV
jgi:pimeloyl-ACP methyl ester carboxylesterase